MSALNVAPPATTPSTARNSTTRITAVMRIPATELWAIRPTSAALRQADQAPTRAMGVVRAAVEEGVAGGRSPGLDPPSAPRTCASTKH
ncbi:MAG: hypothetical protein M3R63_00345 [Actinomycetota bacterium]|nr:hypothetical protein [Actinomycetota bacterium]